MEGDSDRDRYINTYICDNIKYFEVTISHFKNGERAKGIRKGIRT